MYREAVAELEKWIDEKFRNPLLITGARGVGKTWVALDFGDAFFETSVVVDFEKEEELKINIEQELNKNQILRILRNRIGKSIDEKKTFIIFENVHALINPLNFFEFLKKEMKEFYVCGTTYFKPEYLLGIDQYKEMVFVKKISPLSFGEFLIANKENELCSMIEKHKEKPLDKEKLSQIEELLRVFYIVGGMPEAVRNWVEEQDFEKVKEIKKSIITKYLEDFRRIKSKSEEKKVIEVWNSIPGQLNREVKKFHYDIVKLTARKREYEGAVKWLFQRNYIHKLPKIKKEDNFEIFLPDIGLLSLMYEKTYEELTKEINSLLSNNSALIEQFVFQELSGNKSIDKLYYWNSEATARIEFLFEDSGEMIPIEINIDGNKKTQSLKVFRGKYKNPISVRITHENFGAETGVLNIPVYAIWNL